MTDPYTVYNTLIDIMCTRCKPELFRRCKDQNEDLRCRQLIWCMKNLLEVRYLQYPTELLKKTKRGYN